VLSEDKVKMNRDWEMQEATVVNNVINATLISGHMVVKR
jgi:hypothetical protein